MVSVEAIVLQWIEDELSLYIEQAYAKGFLLMVLPW